MKIDIEKLKCELYEMDALRKKDDVQCDTAGRIEPQYFDGDLSELGLSPKVAEAMRKELGDKKLYQHQADAIRTSMRGDNVVLESPTASGKTLSFTAPMLESVCGGGTALMVYPMKAVAYDQRQQIKTLCRSVCIDSWPYDGDASEESRKAIRDNHPKTPVLLTNPDYLHLSFLQFAEMHQEFLRRLSFIVLDEAHEYRGYFGCNVALLIRRFLAKVERLGARPRILIATATCQNPLEHAETLTGRKFTRVSAANAMCPKRHYIFADHDIPDFKFRDIFRLRVVNAAVACQQKGQSVLVFCPSIKFLNAALRDAQRVARNLGISEQSIASFAANLRPERKQEVQEGVKNGSINVVFCTNALELGIDIGLLDGVILAGFPDNVAAARQRIGRAGRSWDSDAFVLYYPQNNPLDKFYAANLRAFLDSEMFPVVADAENEETIVEHAPLLLHELGYNLDDSLKEQLGGKFFAEVMRIAGQGEPVSGYRPFYHPLRGDIGGSHKLKEGTREIGTISDLHKFRDAYLGAVLLHDGVAYRVRSHEADSVILERESRDVRTESSFFTVVTKDGQMFEGVRYKKGNFVMDVLFLKLTIFENITGYKLICNLSDKELERHPLNNVRPYKNRHAVAVSVAGLEELNETAFRSLEQIMRIGAMFAVPADRHDTNTHSKGEELYLYENLPGGIGVARKIFSDWREVMKKGADVARECKCAKGCPNCVVPPRATDEIDKRAGVALAEEILDAVASPETEQYRIQDGQWVKIENNAK